jgi:RNA polymerase sigma factor (sigma-70 family)
MPDGRLRGVLRHLRGAALLRDGGALSDGQLLECFVRDRDEPAFEALVRRLGPMVLGVCRRILGNTHDADDAFQATFLVLVRKAASIASPELLGNWVYGVAYRTALKARRLACRRRTREKQVAQMPEREAVEPEYLKDLQALLDRELNRLPETYRVPVVLCELGGESKKEVARQLGVPEGTVSSRLARGRELLRKRLARQALVLSAEALALVLSQTAASSAVPATLLRSTVRVAALVTTGPGSAAGAMSAPVASLVKAEMRGRFLTKFKVVMVVMVAVCLVGVAAGLMPPQPQTQKSVDPPPAAVGPAAQQLATLAPKKKELPPPGRVADINPTASSNPSWLVKVNGALFFMANDGAHGWELWKSTPTANGPVTVMVKDIYPGGKSSSPCYLTDVNGTLFFMADDGSHGFELWKSDGTEAGTVLVKDINPGPRSSFPLYLTNVNGTLFFLADDGSHGFELWKSDGTEAGTVLVKDINPGRASAFPPGSKSLVAIGNTLFFVANDGSQGSELWKSDGTEAGTVVVKRLDASASISMQFPQCITKVNDTLYFVADDGASGQELWKSDGTEAGTVLVKDIRPGKGSSNPYCLTNVNGTLFFAAGDGVHGHELWKSDGTEAGTVLVKDINPGWANSCPAYLTNVNGTLFFSAIDGLHGRQLWKSDGSEAGTVLVRDIAPGSADWDPMALTNVNGTLYFAANDEVHLRQLWKSDGTTAGTVPIKNLFADNLPTRPVGFIGELTAVEGMLFLVVEWTRSSGVRRLHRELWHMPAGPARHSKE